MAPGFTELEGGLPFPKSHVKIVLAEIPLLVFVKLTTTGEQPLSTLLIKSAVSCATALGQYIIVLAKITQIQKPLMNCASFNTYIIDSYKTPIKWGEKE